MNKFNWSSQFKWLIVVEGLTDIATYRELLIRYGEDKSDFALFHAEGKPNVCDTNTWGDLYSIGHNKNLLRVVITQLQRSTFEGILLVVDTDTKTKEPFSGYKRNISLDRYDTKEQLDKPEKCDGFYKLDSLYGKGKIIPIYGVNVPHDSPGCLETDLLNTLGFPKHSDPEYPCLTDIIKKASKKWGISEWWKDNTEARFDKFIYIAFSSGFQSRNLKYKINLPNEPSVITNIKKAINQ